MGDWEAATEVWPRALPQLLARVEAIEDAVAALLGGALGDDEREAARREAHKLAGSLGSLAVPSGSVLARDLDTALAGAPDLTAAPALAEHVLALRRAVEGGPQQAIGPRVVLAGFSGARAGALMRAAEGRGWRVAAQSEAPAGGDVVLLHSGLAGLEAETERLASAGAAVAVQIEGAADHVALVRAGAARLIGADLRPDAVIAELAELARDRGASPTTVLAVDDEPLSREIVRIALSDAGHAVATCAAPEELWAALERVRPDLLVLDVQMPGADGRDLCRALRADPRWRALPVLFLTSTTDAAAVADLFAAGGDDYVPKPVQPAELVARVAGRLRRMHTAQADTDDDTGLPRRGAAEAELERLIALATRLRQPFTLAVIAVDGFAGLADADRRAGLAATGHVARAALQAGDVAAAWGSGEVVLGLVGDDAHGVRARIGGAVAAVRGAGRLTGSAGLAEHPRDGTDLAALVTSAAGARRDAEAAGGNRLAVAGAPVDGTDRVDVVLVEDDDVLARLILDALAMRGYRARCLRDGDEAAELLGGERPRLKADLVLLDWDLPGRDGLTVLRGLAADGALLASRVVMLTARASQREILTTLELGATDHIAKPFSLAVLMQHVQQVLAR